MVPVAGSCAFSVVRPVAFAMVGSVAFAMVGPVAFPAVGPVVGSVVFGSVAAGLGRVAISYLVFCCLRGSFRGTSKQSPRLGTGPHGRHIHHA
jgi:hypothetical protein